MTSCKLYHCTVSVENMFDCHLNECNVLVVYNIYLPISLADNQFKDSCEVGKLSSIIIHNYTLCTAYVITYLYRNSFAIMLWCSGLMCGMQKIYAVG